MKRSILFMTVASLAGTLLAAPKDEVQSAAKKLGDAGNYSWTSITTNQAAAGGGGGGGGGRGGRGGGFGGGPMQGKTSKDGFALVSRTTGQGTTEAVLKGDKIVVKSQEGTWQTLDEMMQGGGFGAFAFRNLKVPATEAADLLGKAKDLTIADGAYSGDLTDDGVKALLSFGPPRGGGEAPPPPTNTKGSVKFWAKDGALTKYEYNVQGTMSFGGNEIPINRTTTVEIKDVGTTKVDVSEDAKKKL